MQERLDDLGEGIDGRRQAEADDLLPDDGDPRRRARPIAPDEPRADDAARPSPATAGRRARSADAP